MKFYGSFIHNSPQTGNISCVLQQDKPTVIHPHMIGYNLAIKMNRLLIHTTIWVNLQRIVLGEKSQSQKLYCIVLSMQHFCLCGFLFVCFLQYWDLYNIWNDKIIVMESNCACQWLKWRWGLIGSGRGYRKEGNKRDSCYAGNIL
jgi:hypothetical protein